MPAADTARRALELLRRALHDAPPELVLGPDAVKMVGIFAEVERIASAGKALYARRVESTAAFEKDGHRSAATWLAQVCGEPVGQAMGVLEVTREMEQTPAILDAFASGQLSIAQAREIAGAGTRDPEVELELLRSARTESFRELRQRVAREKRHRRTEEEEHAREARVHASRYLRSWEPPEGGLRIEAWLTKLDGAQFLAGIESAANQVFKDVVTTESYERLERYRADALVRLCTCDAQGSALAPPRVLVRVDATSLKRGSVEAGEVCEIAGVGAVSVETARSLMDDAVFNVVIHDGINVLCVSSSKRTIPTALRIALMERDPVCVVPGCTADRHLEIDHWQTDFARGGRTTLSNLARLCKPHHALRTYRGWRLQGGPGNWRWIGPAPDTGRIPAPKRNESNGVRRTTDLGEPLNRTTDSVGPRRDKSPPILVGTS